MAARDMPLIVHSAGRDDALRLALEDLMIGRWLSAKNLLASTGTYWALRTSRSQVLAARAADGGAIDAWYAEEPDSPDALMMRARVLTQRVVNAHRNGTTGQRLLRAIDAARRACWDATRRLPYDPVPWVCLLALAQFDRDASSPHRREHWADPPEALLPPGPWPLLWEVDRRDPENREAYHRMLQCFQARGEGASEFARWKSSVAQAGSVLLTLPLYAYAEALRLRQANRQVASSIGFWTSDQVRHYTQRARDGWFDYVADPTTCSLLDLNHLAYALTACGLPGAGEVFEAIGPYATNAPWAHLSHSQWWEDEFRKARDFALKRRPSSR